MKLYMLLLGCTPSGRFTEQHDIFFGIAESLRELVPDILQSWPEADGKIHIDAWREVNYVDNYTVRVTSKTKPGFPGTSGNLKLFFLNLGGYKQNEFDEYHYKMIVVAENKTMAVQHAKKTAFYKHTGFKSAPSHIDDKYGIDVDDIHYIEDILPQHTKNKYSIMISASSDSGADEIHLGYFRLETLGEW